MSLTSFDQNHVPDTTEGTLNVTTISAQHEHSPSYGIGNDFGVPLSLMPTSPITGACWNVSSVTNQYILRSRNNVV